MRATIEKSKFGPYPRKCEFKVNFGIGVIDKHEEIAQLALDYNIVVKTSTVSHEYGDMKWVGFPKFCEGIKDNLALQAELVTKIGDARNVKWETARKEQEAKKEAALALSTDVEGKKVKKGK
jgi:hypothetical protein